ncbi:MAG TPA: protein kinase, partial [Thermoanaerobaculia bacterium]
MGEVYLARDSRLGREVAIKVLSAEMTSDAAARRRFEQEAKAIAALSHPNILAIHHFDTHDGITYAVTELLEGQTLGGRIGRSRLPWTQACQIAAAISDGLAAAHEKGIIHRDLKPSNVFLTSAGQVKILDFGLARTTAVRGESAETTDLKTSPGAVMGTLGYMSPEQLRGETVDATTDIFALGCILYEMISGRSPFLRSSATETIAAAMRDEPQELAADEAPPALTGLIQRCLAKERSARYQSARDLGFDLRALSLPAPATRRFVGRRNSTTLALVALALLVAAGVATIGYFAGRVPRETPQVTRFHRLTDLPGIEEFPSISPDGRSVAFTASVKGLRQIFVLLLAGGMPVQVTKDAVDHQLPRWSPDGNSLVYFSPAGRNEAEGTIWSIRALGGSPRRVIDSIGSGDISRDGRLACFRLMNGRVELVTSSLDGTEVQVIARSVPGYHLYPRWSPDGQSIAFQRGDGV